MTKKEKIREIIRKRDEKRIEEIIEESNKPEYQYLRDEVDAIIQTQEIIEKLKNK